jgi:F0F1-type ATP synthase membrane subunit b/b'
MSPETTPKPPDEPTPSREPRPQHPLWLPALAAGVIAVGCFALYQNTQIHDLNRDLGAQQKDLIALRTSFASLDGDLRTQFADLRDQLSNTEKESLEKVTEAQVTARKHADSVARKLEQKQAQTTAALGAELDKIKESNTETSTQLAGVTSDVSAVKSDVSAVRTDVDSAKTQLDRSVVELQRMRGDMGVMSGLIATNSKEIDILRQLGDRNIYEFSLSKSSGLTKVGDIRLQLNKVNVRRNQYTLTVNAGDKIIEKKDKTTNEPVQFYVLDKARQPYEIVVNEVSKNAVKGYLATPKVTTARN